MTEILMTLPVRAGSMGTALAVLAAGPAMVLPPGLIGSAGADSVELRLVRGAHFGQ